MDQVSAEIDYITPPWWLSLIFNRSKFLTYFFGPLALLALLLYYGPRFDRWHPHSLPAPWLCVAAVWLLSFFKRSGDFSLDNVFWLCNEPPHCPPLSSLASIGLVDWLMWRLADSGLDRWLCSKIKYVSVYSEAIKSQVASLYGRDARLIRLGIAPIFFQDFRRDYRRELNLRDRFVLLMVGRLHPQKNQRLALRVLWQLSKDSDKVHLVLVGEGPDRAWLEGQVNQLGLTNKVTFFGGASPDQVRDWYHSCDLVLYPSLNQAPPANQSWGLVPLEALACGRLTLISQGTAVEEWYGQYFPDLALLPEELTFASKAREIVSAGVDPERLVKAGEQLFSCFSWPRYAQELEHWLDIG